MITKPTVLILGAGASATYGFDTGQGLVSRIISNLKPLSKNASRGQNDWVPFLVNNFGIDQEEIYSFQEQIYYSRISVDAFLEYRPQFIKLGKIAISLSLICLEHKEKLFNAKRSWMDYLRQKLDAPFDQFGENKLSIITFNYDRSLEQYLFTVIKNTYGKSDDDCAELLSKIPIIHVHGLLGSLPWQSEKCRAYENRIEPELVKLASEQIIVMSEGQETSPQFQKAVQLMEDADDGKVFFLGFGYNDASLQRLKLRELCEAKKFSPCSTGSAYGLAHMDKTRIINSWPINLVNSDWDVLDFLKNTAILE